MKKTLIAATAILMTLATVVPAEAGHPERRQPEDPRLEKVRYLARELSDAARHVHHEAEERSHHDDRAEEHALVRLHRLDDQAERFRREVHKYFHSVYHTEDHFERLVRTYAAADRSLRALHGDRHVRGDFDRVERLMGELAYIYGYDLRYATRRDDRHGRRGHDRGHGYERPRRGYDPYDGWYGGRRGHGHGHDENHGRRARRRP